jgi:hypothetical protein
MNAADPGMIAIQAIKRPESERWAFVESACDGDAELREKVGELIKATWPSTFAMNSAASN